MKPFVIIGLLYVCNKVVGLRSQNHYWGFPQSPGNLEYPPSYPAFQPSSLQTPKKKPCPPHMQEILPDEAKAKRIVPVNVASVEMGCRSLLNQKLKVFTEKQQPDLPLTVASIRPDNLHALTFRLRDVLKVCQHGINWCLPPYQIIMRVAVVNKKLNIVRLDSSNQELSYDMNLVPISFQKKFREWPFVHIQAPSWQRLVRNWFGFFY